MYTYDLATTVGKMRMLIGDNGGFGVADFTDAAFSDEELQAISAGTQAMLMGPTYAGGTYSIPETEILMLSCANALESLAAKAASNSNDIRLGSLTLNDRFKVSSVQAQADRFRNAVNSMPAWGIAEENSCGFNELTIIRNWVLRTEL